MGNRESDGGDNQQQQHSGLASPSAVEQYAQWVREFIPRVLDGIEQSFAYSIETGRKLCGPCTDRNCPCACVTVCMVPCACACVPALMRALALLSFDDDAATHSNNTNCAPPTPQLPTAATAHVVRSMYDLVIITSSLSSPPSHYPFLPTIITVQVTRANRRTALLWRA